MTGRGNNTLLSKELNKVFRAFKATKIIEISKVREEIKTKKSKEPKSELEFTF